MTQQIQNDIKEAIKTGLIFSVTFTKKDGTQRDMVARSGVKKHLKGDGPSTTAHIPKYFTVFDMQKAAYRTINIETICKFKCNIEFTGPAIEV